MRTNRGLAAAIAIAGLAALPAAASAKGFRYGVTASEVTSNSAILWTRADKAGKLTLELSRDRRFGNRDDVRRTLSARATDDNTAQVKVGGLDPGHKYYFYRFRQGKKNISRLGRFVTAPDLTQAKTITFAYSGDADAQRAAGETKPFYNLFEVYRQMAKEGNDFNVNLGDTIYSDSEVGSTITNGNVVPGSPTALTVAEKWAKYRQNLALRNLQFVRRTTGMYNHWDDHEFVNDFSPPEMGSELYQASARAFLDYMPTTFSAKNGIYRSFRWGKNAEVFFLDERSFRSAKASANHVCDNPDTGYPDLAPTLPQRLRDTFAALVPSLARPVSQQCLDTIRDPNRTMLGSAQLADFKRRLAGSKAKFKIVMNEVPIQQYYAYPLDQWEGYEAERQDLLRYIQAKVKNVVFLTTDTHANFYNDARLSTMPEEGGTVDSGIKEMVTGPVATRTFAVEIDLGSGREGSADLLTGVFLKPQPPDGVGMECAQMNVYSYTEVKVTSTALTLTPKDLNGKPVRENGSGDQPGPQCGPFTIPAK